jgi:hypothetical protein
MASEIKDSVKEYYGKILQTNEDLKTNACVQVGKVPKQVKEALNLCHEEVLSRYSEFISCIYLYSMELDDKHFAIHQLWIAHLYQRNFF